MPKEKFYERIKARIKDVTTRIRPPAEVRKFNESQNIAREAVMLFASGEHQESLASYESGAGNIIELSQQKPGTIIRVKASLREDYPAGFFWYVLGNQGPQGRDVFHITHGNMLLDHDYVEYYYKERLRLRPDWTLKNKVVEETVFSPENSLQVLSSSDFPYIQFMGKHLPYKTVDIMFSGLPEKKRVPIRRRVQQKKLQLNPAGAR